MTTEEMRTIWRQRQAGWDEAHRRDVEWERQRTPNDRMTDLDAMVEFARQTGMRPPMKRDSAVMERWQRLRDHYARKPGNSV